MYPGPVEESDGFTAMAAGIGSEVIRHGVDDLQEIIGFFRRDDDTDPFVMPAFQE